MSIPATFQVYNASAGSGKTFTLVKEYLKVLLQSADQFAFQKILAVTFTNKAAGEMKDRVLENLQAFADGKSTDILPLILDETNLDSSIIKQRSQTILNAILQNYAAFGIETIDSFTHKLIRGFAFDLGLNMSFEIELDAKTLLNQAVDLLISKIGIEEKLTKLLIDFSIEKADDDKSWDIARELNEFAAVLLSENDAPHFKNLAKKSLDDFLDLNKKLKDFNKKIENRFSEIGNRGLLIIKNSHLDHSEFAYGGELPKHFSKLINYKFLKIDDLKFTGRLNKTIEERKNLFSAKASERSKDKIGSIQDELIAIYYESKTLYESEHSAYQLNKLALKNLIPLAVLNKLNNELTAIKEEHNIRLLSEFNQLIWEAIKDQPAPFIYERIGQKLMHYFVDEMQDTSYLQWQNLIPLIGNSLAQENSSLLLVGDGKQAIYRWRGGKAEQFIHLGNQSLHTVETNPFQTNKSVKKLDTNRRSYSEIIEFTNRFFQQVAGHLQNPNYQQLFIDGNRQKATSKKGGFVSIDFLEKEENSEENSLKFAKRCLEIIRQLDGVFKKGEICILVRKNKHGVALANYLSEHGISIVSSESLLLQNSPNVNFIVNLLQLIEHPNDKEVRLEILYFLFDHLGIASEKHPFFEKRIHADTEVFFMEFAALGIDFNLERVNQLPLYEKTEEIIRSFHLITTSDAYVQLFLDVVFEQQQKGASNQGFLDFWEQKKEKLSITASENETSVQIMTIHKAKGLEFPVVIVPYDIEIYKQLNPKAWLGDLPTETFGDFEELLVSSNQSIRDINETGAEIYQQQREELELDNFNILYVALTRAIEQLYVITDKRIKSSGEVDTNYVSGIFIEYLQQQNYWNDDQLRYTFGDVNRKSLPKEVKSNSILQEKYISNSWQNRNIYAVAKASKLWGTEHGKAIEFGNLMHEIASKIYTEEDVEAIVYQYYQSGILDKNQLVFITERFIEIAKHPKLKEYYSDKLSVFNEREIMSNTGQIIIPDRLVVNAKKEAVIIDYKTGKPAKEHHQQLLHYGDVIASIDFKIIKKLLVYVEGEILVEEVS